MAQNFYYSVATTNEQNDKINALLAHTDNQIV